MVKNIQDYGQRLSSIESNTTSYSDRLGVLETSVNDLANKMASDDQIKDFRRVPGAIMVRFL